MECYRDRHRSLARRQGRFPFDVFDCRSTSLDRLIVLIRRRAIRWAVAFLSTAKWSLRSGCNLLDRNNCLRHHRLCWLLSGEWSRGTLRSFSCRRRNFVGRYLVNGGARRREGL